LYFNRCGIRKEGKKMSQTALEDACFEARAESYGLTPAELCDLESEMVTILKELSPRKDYDTYLGIAYKLLDKVYRVNND
jgi:hypothetical protein